VPSFLGRRVIADQPLSELVPLIDWTFFFTARKLRGRYPAILEHRKYGAAARELFADGKQKLDELVKGKRIRAAGVYGFWPAASVSGIYLAHPQARYFDVGRLGRDQVEDYAARKGISVADAERMLSSRLGY
jgi:5-methyltetrahydrofolate--homocysteine methyltransferase